MVKRLGDDKVLIFDDFVRKFAVFLRLVFIGSYSDDGFLVELGLLHDIVARYEVNHLRADGRGKFFHKLSFPVDFSAVADDPAKTHAALVRVLDKALADIVRRVDRHHFAGGDDVDLLGLALADRHGEPAADDVAEHVEEDEIKSGV